MRVYIYWIVPYMFIKKMRCFALYTDALANSIAVAISIIDAILQLLVLTGKLSQ